MAWVFVGVSSASSSESRAPRRPCFLFWVRDGCVDFEERVLSGIAKIPARTMKVSTELEQIDATRLVILITGTPQHVMLQLNAIDLAIASRWRTSWNSFQIPESQHYAIDMLEGNHRPEWWSKMLHAHWCPTRTAAQLRSPSPYRDRTHNSFSSGVPQSNGTRYEAQLFANESRFTWIDIYRRDDGRNVAIHILSRRHTSLPPARPLSLISTLGYLSCPFLPVRCHHCLPWWPLLTSHTPYERSQAHTIYYHRCRRNGGLWWGQTNVDDYDVLVELQIPIKPISARLRCLQDLRL